MRNYDTTPLQRLIENVVMNELGYGPFADYQERKDQESDLSLHLSMMELKTRGGVSCWEPPRPIDVEFVPNPQVDIRDLFFEESRARFLSQI